MRYRIYCGYGDGTLPVIVDETGRSIVAITQFVPHPMMPDPEAMRIAQICLAALNTPDPTPEDFQD